MIKKYLPLLFITSLVILLPIIAGVYLWDRLPEQLPFHWNVQGQVDQYVSKPLAVLGMPFLLLAIHWMCVVSTSLDPKNKNIDAKPMQLVLWIAPMLSIVLHSVVYLTALEHSLRVEVILPLLLGALFVVIGNYLPKCRQNYTVGIKLPWTMDDAENWNKTHRFSGAVWVCGGLIIMVTAFLGTFVIFAAAVLLMALLPVIYSYCLYAKKQK